jgi:hypothetical protein
MKIDMDREWRNRCAQQVIDNWVNTNFRNEDLDIVNIVMAYWADIESQERDYENGVGPMPDPNSTLSRVLSPAYLTADGWLRSPPFQWPGRQSNRGNRITVEDLMPPQSIPNYEIANRFGDLSQWSDMESDGEDRMTEGGHARVWHAPLQVPRLYQEESYREPLRMSYDELSARNPPADVYYPPPPPPPPPPAYIGPAYIGPAANRPGRLPQHQPGPPPRLIALMQPAPPAVLMPPPQHWAQAAHLADMMNNPPRRPQRPYHRHAAMSTGANPVRRRYGATVPRRQHQDEEDPRRNPVRGYNPYKDFYRED